MVATQNNVSETAPSKYQEPARNELEYQRRQIVRRAVRDKVSSESKSEAGSSCNASLDGAHRTPSCSRCAV